jgi:hypothetical protein
MKKLSLNRETLKALTNSQTDLIAGGASKEASACIPGGSCPYPGTDTDCLVLTQMAYCNTTKCTTYAGC